MAAGTVKTRVTPSELSIFARLSSGSSLLQVVTHEEKRALDSITALVQQRLQTVFHSIWTWSITRGYTRIWLSPELAERAEAGGKDSSKYTAIVNEAPTIALQFKGTMFDSIYAFSQAHLHSLLILLDYDEVLANPAFQLTASRTLLDCAALGVAVPANDTDELSSLALLVLGTTDNVSRRLRTNMPLVDYALPNEEQLRNCALPSLEEHYTAFPLSYVPGADTAAPKKKAEVAAALFARSAAGLTQNEALQALTLSLTGKSRTVLPEVIIEERRQIVRRSGVLEFIVPTLGMDSVGGLGRLKKWLGARSKAFTPEAKAFGLVTPKAVLIAGVPGTGKSLSAKAIGASWNMPILRLDMGSLLGSLVGQSESNMRLAIATAEAVAPCILWVNWAHYKSCELLERA